jgi:hypothetical protein
MISTIALTMLIIAMNIPSNITILKKGREEVMEDLRVMIKYQAALLHSPALVSCQLTHLVALISNVHKRPGTDRFAITDV